MRLSIIFVSIATLLFTACSGFRFTQKPYPESATFLLCSVRGNNQSFSNAERFGFFSSTLWENYEVNLQKEIDVFGATPGYILWYIQMGEAFPLHVAEHNKTLGIATVINHDLKADGFHPERNNKILNEIIHGKWDAYFRDFARKARNLDTDVYYRFGYEMNGDWFPWCGRPKLFKEAWRHTWKIFKKEKAFNVKWVFSPTVVWGQKTFKNDIEPYYPGEHYVNIVALDGYNFGDNYTKYHSWESFYHVYAGSVAGLMSFDKPMWIAEIGCPSDPRRQKWLRDFLDFFDNNSCFQVFFWFNENKDGEPNFRIDADAASLYTFREWAQRINQPDQSTDHVASAY